jgi:hypothetical protein
VDQQWEATSQFYDTHLKDVLGPLTGRSSDGDSRRRKLMLRRAVSRESDRYWPIPEDEGFVFSYSKINSNDGTFTVSDIHDQDYVHNIKKLVNHLFHASREMKVGPYTIHSNHLRLVYDTFDVVQHGLIQEDVIRTDRQNFRSAQRVCFVKVQNCLHQLIEGTIENHAPDASLKGTWMYLKLLWCYCEIFLSETTLLQDRIMYCSLVIHFLGIWHNHIQRRPGQNLAKHFLSRQTYIDVLLSCHASVAMICCMRENFSTAPCCLDLTGTDVVESFFSKNGQWVGNRHNYSFTRMERNLTHMIRLEEIRSDPNAPSLTDHILKQRLFGAGNQLT